MNEFTIEELVLIACWSANRCEQVGDDQAQDEGTISLSHKIQDMIVNYCDHEWNIEEIMKKIVLNPGEAFPVECKKCGLPYRC